MSTELGKDLEKKTCHDCGAKPGNLHDAGCDTERCPECGGQIISCDCFTDETWPQDVRRLPWTGIWPGVVECIEFGWYCKWVVNPNGAPGSAVAPGRLVRCGEDDPEATADLNRLGCGEARWDKNLKRWVLT